MTNKQAEGDQRIAVNRKIAEFMGLCALSDFDGDYDYEPARCKHCDRTATYHYSQVPDYCSSDSPRSLLEGVLDKVTEKVGKDRLERAILDEIRGKDDRIESYPGGAVGVSAKYLARACASCIEAEGIGGEDA